MKTKDEILKTNHRKHQIERRTEPIYPSSSRGPTNVSSTTRKKKQFGKCRKRLTNTKGKSNVLKKRSKSKKTRITEALPSTPGPNLMRPKTPRAQDIAYKAIIEATEKGKNEGK